MIDAVSSEYDSYIFDIGKLLQDVECKWFIRNVPVRLDVKLNNIKESIIDYFGISDYKSFLILMLLRVYPYAKNADDVNFLKKAINRLWR
jgi:hypothetical protein